MPKKSHKKTKQKQKQKQVQNVKQIVNVNIPKSRSIKKTKQPEKLQDLSQNQLSRMNYYSSNLSMDPYALASIKLQDEIKDLLKNKANTITAPAIVQKKDENTPLKASGVSTGIQVGSLNTPKVDTYGISPLKVIDQKKFLQEEFAKQQAIKEEQTRPLMQRSISPIPMPTQKNAFDLLRSTIGEATKKRSATAPVRRRIKTNIESDDISKFLVVNASGNK